MTSEKWQMIADGYRQAHSRIEEALRVLKASLKACDEQKGPLPRTSKILLENGETIYKLTKTANATIANIGETLMAEVLLEGLTRDKAA